jgi:hypothetical protein
MIRIIKEDRRLVLEYNAELISVEWVDRELEKKGIVSIAGRFHFSREQLIVSGEEEPGFLDARRFILAELEGEYYKTKKEILGLEFDLLLNKNMRINEKTFIAERRVSIFRKIDQLVHKQIYVGGEYEGAISISDFEILLSDFPTKTELNYYAQSRITRILKDYFEDVPDAEKKLNDYLRRRGRINKKAGVDSLYEYEVEKYRYIRDCLVEMLEDADSYSENDWQKKIIEFLLLLFPKYIAVLEKIQIKDFYTDSKRCIDRYVDLTLVDANGNVDIIEIKKPFKACLLSSSRYRDNYTPKKELAGAVMQVEKYIFHLNKWGVDGERILNQKHAAILPSGVLLKITNPKGLIVIGRDDDLGLDQKFDLEIIKRKYAHIIDIITYDDLLVRINNIIARFQQK